MNKEDNTGWGVVALFASLHFLCCGIPLLLLSGVSLAFLAPHWPIAAAGLAALAAWRFIALRSRARKHSATARHD